MFLFRCFFLFSYKLTFIMLIYNCFRIYPFRIPLFLFFLLILIVFVLISLPINILKFDELIMCQIELDYWQKRIHIKVHVDDEIVPLLASSLFVVSCSAGRGEIIDRWNEKPFPEDQKHMRMDTTVPMCKHPGFLLPCHCLTRVEVPVA